MRLLSALAACTAAIWVASSPANATATYVYRGNPFDTIRDSEILGGSYDMSMRVTASITLTAPLGPDLDAESVTGRIIAAHERFTRSDEPECPF